MSRTKSIFFDTLMLDRSFRRIAIATATILLTTAFSLPASATENTSADLTSGRQVDDIDRVDSLLEAEGKILFGNGPEDQADLKLSCRYQYDERLLHSAPITVKAESDDATPREDADAARLAVRHYRHLEGKLGEGERQAKIGVRPERMMVGIETDSEGVTVFSPLGPLMADELDTFDTPANTLLWDRLLPGKEMKIGESWTHDDRLVAAILHLEAIASNNLTSTLKSVDERHAQIEMSGNIEGADDGISNTVEVTAKYRFDLQTKRIDWLALLIRQKRGISRVGDGLDVTLRLQTQVTPIETSDELTDASLTDRALRPTEEQKLISHQSGDSKWTIEHDRSWSAVMGEAGRTVLRFIDRGEFAVQCVAATMPTIKPEDLPQLDQFQKQIEGKLGKYFGQFVSAAEKVTPSGLQIYEVAAIGQIDQVEVHWIYYLVSDPYGRQMILAMTMESERYEKYENLGDPIAESVRFPARIRTSSRPSE